jgi:hypothetical protein
MDSKLILREFIDHAPSSQEENPRAPVVERSWQYRHAYGLLTDYHEDDMDEDTDGVGKGKAVIMRRQIRSSMRIARRDQCLSSKPIRTEMWKT